MKKFITDLQIKKTKKDLSIGKPQAQKPDEKSDIIREKPKKSRKKKIIIILIVLLLIVAGAAAYFLWPREKKLEEVPQKSKNEEKVETSPFDTESPLNGVMTTNKIAQRRPEAVVIENHPDARPQSGLDKADLVYEAITEGGITRFLAFYVVNDVSEIGPVRSARPYFVKFADEYNAFFAHVGGSGSALSLIDELNDFYDLNQFSLGKYFWRDKKRYAPHNVYTTTDMLREAGESKKWDANAEYEKWSFKDGKSTEDRGNTQKITIDFSSSSYKVDYYYDKEKNEYRRNLVGKEHIDKNSKNQIKTKNVIIQYVESWPKEQGIDIKNDGTEKAVIFMDGEKITGTWKKSGRKKRTMFYDENGNEIAFNRGPIWIEMASANVKITDQ